MSPIVRLLTLFIFMTLVYSYPLGRPLNVLAVDDSILDMLQTSTPLLQSLSQVFGSVSPQALLETSSIPRNINAGDLAASFATTMLGGGLALYFT
ncbi:hypothetical protein BU17DRAFT_87002 [Hysterangium stoloniferum]|nr:hypothetical protein BU17DRAFT_87002 [Hysterangium stoloniferum]